MLRLPAIVVYLLFGLFAAVALADDAARLADLDRLLSEGRAAEVVANTARILEAGDVEPRNTWRFRQRLAVALVALGRPAEAMPILELAIADAPDEPALHLNLARSLRSIGHGGRAVAEFQLAVNLAPQQYEWRLEYAEALLALGIRRDSLIQIRQAREICGGCPEALRGEINYHLTTGRPDAAVGPLRELQMLEPSPAIRGLLVRTLWALDDAEAVAAVLDTVPEDELDGGDLALLLDVDRRLGRTERALRWVLDDADTAERVARPTDQVWAILSEICLAGGDPGAALAAIDRALALEPGVAVYHHNRAAILVALGREDDARTALAEAHRLDPDLGRSP